MFKQFLDRVEGNQGYLISSLAIFLVFFVLVGIYLLTMKKDEVEYMSALPLNEESDERGN